MNRSLSTFKTQRWDEIDGRGKWRRKFMYSIKYQCKDPESDAVELIIFLNQCRFPEVFASSILLM